MTETVKFLSTRELRPLEFEGDGIHRLRGIALGQGNMALEVVVCEARNCPTSTQMRNLFRKRQAGRATPVLIVVLYGESAAVCGPVGDDPPCYTDLDVALLDRTCNVALSEPDRHAALRFIKVALPDIGSPIPGLRNEGFLASHELQTGVPKRKEWDHASKQGRQALRKSGRDLVRTLGFDVQELPNQMSVLISRDKKVAVAIFLERNESSDIACERYSGLTPVSQALSCADQERLPYVMIVSDRRLRLYPVSTGIGVGRRGRTETFVEAHLDIIPESQAAYVWYLFSSEALCDNGFLDDILDRSNDYSADLGKRLRERVYDSVVPGLAMGISEARGLKRPTSDQLRETYQMALTTLFRLLFVAYGEDKELLPYRSNEAFRKRSLKQKAHELQRFSYAKGKFDSSTSHWDEVRLLFDAVNKGHREWGVPAYDGTLFSEDRGVNKAGAVLSEIRLKNEVFGPILVDLLLDHTAEGVVGPVDFRSLGVREFGTIYEGLLESELAVAEEDLATDKEGRYCPTNNARNVRAKKGEVYLVDASGSRKSLGSFFTKSFAVDHLLDRALEPALKEHVARLDSLPDDAAGEAFFDFRVADIAMGSGHFLVAAVDRIERALTSYLTRRTLVAVSKELTRLRTAAKDALGPLAEDADIEDAQLLRRQIARRCIYGVDLNPIAVNLARLSIWIHTFVPGLPLSLLDQHLVQGNSLVGIATAKEAEDLLGARKWRTLFSGDARDLLRDVAESMLRVGKLSDATTREVLHARSEWEKAKKDAEPWMALMDILAASRLDEQLHQSLPEVFSKWTEDPSRILKSRYYERAREILKAIPPFHYPIAFPEVFWRERSGFDVILGNPPWEEATIEENKFWVRYAPGLAGLKQVDQEVLKEKLRRDRPDLVRHYQEQVAAVELLRRVLTTGAFFGMGTGDPDLYKAFYSRFWQLLAPFAFMGVVLPRSAFLAKGSAEFRSVLLNQATIHDLTFVVNTGGWVFDDAEPRYTIAFVAAQKANPGKSAVVPLRGPFSSHQRFRQGIAQKPFEFAVSDILMWTDIAALPLLPSEKSVEIFAQLRKAPRLDLDGSGSWRARPTAELHATHDKKENGGIIFFSKTRPHNCWPVYGGESFDIWNPDTGSYYGWVKLPQAMDYMQQKRMNAARSGRSAFSELPMEWIENPKTLPCLSPRIAFRDVTNRTNRRTVISCLLPPDVVVTNKGPYLLWPRGDERDQAYLLGVLSSIPLDWYARRFVETNVNFFIFNPFPVPRPGRSNPCWSRVVKLAGRLACSDSRFAPWGKKVGVDVGPIPEERKQEMIAELDAVVAHLYGLSEDQLCHVFETFHEGWDFKERLKTTLDYYRKCRGKNET